MQEYLKKGTKLSENFWVHLECQDNPIQMIIKIFSDKYHRTVNPRTIMENYLSHMLAVRERVQALYLNGSSSAFELQVIDQKYQKLKEMFEFFEGTKSDQFTRSTFPN